MNYCIVSIICIIALILGIIMLLENEMMSIEVKKRFTYLAGLIIGEIIVDMVLITINEEDLVPKNIGEILRIIEFSVPPIIVEVLSSIITHKRSWKEFRKLFVGLSLINLIGQIGATFIFEVDKSISYYNTPYAYIYLVILFVCIALLIISTRNSIIQNNSKISYTIIFSTVFLVIGINIRMYYPKTNFNWLCTTFCYLIFIIHFCNNSFKLDSLTFLLNRRAFDNKLKEINFSTALIIIDANEFKQINDNYGHQSGDFALTKISEAIFKVYSQIGFCYRIGGDEFCVILRQGMLKKLTCETENCDVILNQLLRKLNKEIQDISNQYPSLKNGVAQGYGIYFSNKDMPTVEKSVTIEEVFKIADDRMYKNKSESKHTDLNE